MSGVSDGSCDGVADGRCDPDCAKGADPDCIGCGDLGDGGGVAGRGMCGFSGFASGCCIISDFLNRVAGTAFTLSYDLNRCNLI